MASTPPIPASSARESQSEASDAILTLSTEFAKIIGKRERVEAVILVPTEMKRGELKYELDEGPGVAAKLLSKHLQHLRDGIDICANASNLDRALECFTASIAHAEYGSQLMVTCQIRAIVLQKMRNYDAAVADLDRALLSNPSSEIKQDLEDQKAECLRAKTEYATAFMVQQPSHTDLESYIGRSDGAEEQWSSLLELANPHTPNPFPRIRYAYDAKRGQYLEAAEDIEPGQLIISDKFWTVRLKDKFKYEYCSYCFKRCVTLIPCPSCAREMYCGETCQKEANDSYHRLECKITRKTSSWGTLETMLTRMILVSTEQGKRLNDLMQTDKAVELFSSDHRASAAFGEVYPRVLGLRRTKCNLEIIDEYVSTAARIIVWLERVGFFDVNSSPRSPPAYRADQHTLTEAQAFVGILLLNYAIASETHSFKFVSHGYGLTTIRNRRMGVGVTALPSVLRHSCHPNARISNHHRNLVISAECRIRKGEEIFVSYIRIADSPDSPPRERLVVVFNHSGDACECDVCANELSRLEHLEDVSKGASPMETAKPPGFEPSAESSSETKGLPEKADLPHSHSDPNVR